MQHEFGDLIGQIEDIDWLAVQSDELAAWPVDAEAGEIVMDRGSLLELLGW